MVTLRYKPLKSGKYSLYLDKYEDQKRKRMFLGLHVANDYSKNKKIAKEDIQVMQAAHQKLSELNYDTVQKTDISESLTLRELLEQESNSSTSSRRNAQSMLKHLEQYSPGKDWSMDEINENWIKRFTTYLAQNMAPSTTHRLIYFLRYMFNDVFKNNKKLIAELKTIAGNKNNGQPIQYLDAKEIDLLIKAETPIHVNENAKLAFMFSIYSGLRWGSIKNLRWEQIDMKNKKAWQLIIQNKQTQKPFSLLLPKLAAKLLEKLKTESNKGLVFPMLPNNCICNKYLKLWAAQAGIDKDLCFSMGRNTFAMESSNKNGAIATMHTMGITNKTHFKVYEQMYKNLNKK